MVRGLDQFAVRSSAFFTRKRMAAAVKWSRQAIHSPRMQQLLADTLRGSLGDQVSWTDETLRDHTLRAVAEQFADDVNWCVQVMLTVYLLNPTSIEQIDRIIAEHVESRDGTFPPELYEGRGWNPAEAIYFIGDTHRYWRIYRAYTAGDWSAIDGLIKTGEGTNPWASSGYRLSGTRGCVRHLELTHSVDLNAAPGYAETFLRSARRFVSKALKNPDADDLWQAVRQQADYDGHIGPVRVRFFARIVPRYREEPGSRDFVLTLAYE